jgi:hypothetical protein
MLKTPDDKKLRELQRHAKKVVPPPSTRLPLSEQLPPTTRANGKPPVFRPEPPNGDDLVACINTQFGLNADDDERLLPESASEGHIPSPVLHADEEEMHPGSSTTVIGAVPEEAPSGPEPIPFNLLSDGGVGLPMGYFLTCIGRDGNRFSFEITAPMESSEETGGTYVFDIIEGKPRNVSFKSMTLEIVPGPDEYDVLITPSEHKYHDPGRVGKWFGRHLPSLTFGTLTLATWAVTNVLVPEFQQNIDASELPSFLKSYLYQFIFPAMQLALSAWVFVDERVRKKI